MRRADRRRTPAVAPTVAGAAAAAAGSVLGQMVEHPAAQVAVVPVAAAAGAAAVWWAYGHAERALEPLVDTVEKLRLGEVSSRTGVVAAGKYGELAGALDRLAGELETRHARTSEQLRRDELTGLLNRTAFEHTLADALQHGLVGVMWADIDHFKHVNDSYGHPVGDEVLREVAARVRGALRHGDAAARVGGEEFAIVVRDVSPDELTAVAERVRATVAATPVATSVGEVPVTMSVGVAAGEGRAAESLTHAADEALYVAKRGGRNRVAAASSVQPA